MVRLRLFTIGLFIILLSLNLSADVGPSCARQAGGHGARARQENVPSAERALEEHKLVLTPAPSRTGIQVTLTAPHSTTSWDERDPDRQKFELPLLYLHRQRQATPTTERTLELSVVGLPGGDEIEIEIVSHHENVSTRAAHTETRRFVTPDAPCTTDAPCWFHWTFDPTATPSDLYYLRVKDDAGNTLWGNPSLPAFVLLDTWDTALGGDRDVAYTARVYYATLFPFARGAHDLDRRLPPSAVTDFVEREFVPIIRETWDTQVEEWGLAQPLHPDWDADKVIEVVVTDPPFALFEGTGTYTLFTGGDGRFSSTRRIWWFSSNNSFRNYDSLEDGYKALLPHEFFHLLQWNTLLFTADPESYWYSWREGQATAIPSVQYPEMADNTYARFAERFLMRRLNSSYREMEADAERWHEAALYWHFLYEQYNDMAIFRAALEEMVRRADARHDNGDFPIAMKSALDAAFTRVSGPFYSYDESLIAFARANYGLRLENGRCATANYGECSGRYYDPDNRYVEPPLEGDLAYDGSVLTYTGSIPVSYGMDFIEVHLAPALPGQPLTIRFEGAGQVARFNLQVWKLKLGHQKPRAVTLQPDEVKQAQDRSYVYHISEVDITVVDRLGLIITRLDPDETTDPEGSYHITLNSMAASDLP